MSYNPRIAMKKNLDQFWENKAMLEKVKDCRKFCERNTRDLLTLKTLTTRQRSLGSEKSTNWM